MKGRDHLEVRRKEVEKAGTMADEDRRRESENEDPKKPLQGLKIVKVPVRRPLISNQ